MSWFNNNSSEFIDGTQQFSSTGSGGNIQIVDGNEVNITDLVELRLDHLGNEYEQSNPTETLNLYLKNSNTGGEIRFLTEEAVNNNDVSNEALKYVTKIAADGKLYFYYTFNPVISVLQFSGWRELGSTLIGVRQGVDNNIGAIAGITGEIGVINSTLNIQSLSISSLNAGLTSAETTIIDHEARIQILEAQDQVEDFEYDDTIETDLITGRNLRDELSQQVSVDLFTRAVRFQSLGRIRQIYKIKGISAYKPIIVFAFNLLGIGGTIVAIIALAGRILDEVSKAEELDNLKTTLALKTRITDSTDQAPFVQNKLHLGGLQIDQTTNNSFSTAGDYEVDVIKNGRLNINIAGNPLVATITEILETGDFFTTSDVINVNKNNIGGTTGSLTINITSLKSLNEILDDRINESIGNLDDIANRQRRRQFIPNKNDFGDGLQVTETNITEVLGDTTKDLDISLKVDTSQFNYDATGNLQLTNYSQIAQNATDIATNTTNIATNTGNISAIDTRTGNLETYTASLQTQINTANTNISQNATDIGNNETQISTNQTINQLGISTNAQSIITINNTLSTIQTDINNLQSSDTDVYKLLLNNNETYSTTTDHIVNIGFNKTEFSSVLFNLIMGAVKVNSGLNDIPFSITDFSRYYFGLYPSASRLNYDPVITLVKQDNSKYYNDTNWNNGGLVQMGAYYYTNISSGVVYDLNKRFEWYGNIRFRNLDSSGNNYILRTAYEFEEVIGTPSYAHDINKMAFYYRDGNFYFSHLCKYNLTYYAIRLNQDILSDFLNPLVTFSNTTPVYGNGAGYLDLNITGGGFNEQLYLSIRESFYSVTQTTIEGLINTSANSNPLFCGMVQKYSTSSHDPFGIIRLEYPQYTSGNLFKIARLEIEYQIMRNSGYYDASNNWVSTGWVQAIPQTQQDLNNMYEELIMEFYQSYSDTSPSLTILIDTRQFYSTTTNTIIIDFDLSPDLYTYTYEKWIIKPRFTSQFSSGYPLFPAVGYSLVPNQRSAFIHKVKMFRYIQKTIAREQVEEFSDGVNHTLSAFSYNKMTFHTGLNRNVAPFQDIWYKLNNNLDANKYTITIPQTFNTTNLSDITDLPPNVLSLQVDTIDLTQPFFISSGQSGITESNHILIIGDENLSNRLYITHYGWRFLLPTDSSISETDLDNLDYVKNYNYYHRTAVCDRFLSCKEFYADVIDFKRLLIDGSLSYDEMTTGEFGTLSNSSDGNNIKSLASVNIQNLYGLTASGYLYFDTTNGFSVTSTSGTTFWTQINAVTIYYPNTIECDRVNATTLVLSGVASSITFSDGTFLQTASGLNQYTDADVRNVLSQSASPSISWDGNNNFFVVNQSILSDITNNAVAIQTNQSSIINLNNLIEDVSGSTKIKATSDIIFENNLIEKMRLDVNGNLGIGTNAPILPIDISNLPNGWFRINDFGHLKLRNTATNHRWDIGIRSSGLLSFSTIPNATADNGIINSTNNVMVITSGGYVGIGTNNPQSTLDVNGIINCQILYASAGINGISATELGYLSSITSDLQTQLNSLDSRISANNTAIQFQSSQIITLNNDTSTNTSRSLQNQSDIATLTTSVNNVSYISSLLYNINQDTLLDALQTFNLTINGTSVLRALNSTGIIPNAVMVNQNALTSSGTTMTFGLEMTDKSILLNGTNANIIMKDSGYIVRGKGGLFPTLNEIMDLNDGNSFFRLSTLGQMLIRNKNNANRFFLGIRNSGRFSIANDTSTNSGAISGTQDKIRIEPNGEVEVRYNLKVGDANGALLTEISLHNLPTSAPAQANRVWRDTNGFLRIT